MKAQRISSSNFGVVQSFSIFLLLYISECSVYIAFIVEYILLYKNNVTNSRKSRLTKLRLSLGTIVTPVRSIKGSDKHLHPRFWVEERNLCTRTYGYTLKHLVKIH